MDIVISAALGKTHMFALARLRLQQHESYSQLWRMT